MTALTLSDEVSTLFLAWRESDQSLRRPGRDALLERLLVIDLLVVFCVLRCGVIANRILRVSFLFP